MEPPLVSAALQYFDKILLSMDSLCCTLQDKVNIMGCIAAGGSVTSTKMAAKMAANLDFTQNSNLPGKCENFKYFLLECYSVIELNILVLLVALYMFFFFHRKTVKTTHFYSKVA